MEGGGFWNMKANKLKRKDTQINFHYKVSSFGKYVFSFRLKFPQEKHEKRPVRYLKEENTYTSKISYLPFSKPK